MEYIEVVLRAKSFSVEIGRPYADRDKRILRYIIGGYGTYWLSITPEESELVGLQIKKYKESKAFDRKMERLLSD